MQALDRFREAQDQSRAGFEAALAEIRGGGKRGHWIWYVFPQLSGLGSSYASQFYGLADVKEAAEYLDDPVLRRRLLTIASAIAEQLRTGVTLRELMGGDIDARKLVSSLTLFGHLAEHSRTRFPEGEYQTLADVATEVLRAAESEGYPRCAYTQGHLRGWP